MGYEKFDLMIYNETQGIPVETIDHIKPEEMPGRKQALMDFLGGAGYLFKDISELPEIISKPYPEELRLLGLENAKKCDVYQHNSLLKELWEKSPSS